MKWWEMRWATFIACVQHISQKALIQDRVWKNMLYGLMTFKMIFSADYIKAVSVARIQSVEYWGRKIGLKRSVLALIKVLSRRLPGGIRKPPKTLSHDSGCRWRDSNPTSPEYECRRRRYANLFVRMGLSRTGSENVDWVLVALVREQWQFLEYGSESSGSTTLPD
jgi:hypothetical protein